MDGHSTVTRIASEIREWELTALPWPESPEHPDTCRMLGECVDIGLTSPHQHDLLFQLVVAKPADERNRPRACVERGRTDTGSRAELVAALPA